MEQARTDSPPSSLARPRVGGLLAGGTRGNELLTATTGALLIVLLAIIGVTILQIGSLLWVHLFVGLALIGPLALKLASTGYRAARYYMHSPRYRLRGAPPASMRLSAPVLVLSTVVVMASGVVLLFAGPGSRDTYLPIHKDAFFVWLAFTGLHVLGHMPELSRGARADYGLKARLGSAPRGRNGRTLALASALALGAIIALVCIPEFAPWIHAHFHHHH